MSQQRGRLRRPASTARLLGFLGLLLASVLLPGCGGEPGSAPSSTASGPTAASPPPSSPARPALLAPGQRCAGGEATPAHTLWLRTSDGVDLDAVETGQGRVGAVFLHMSPSDLCDWWPYAKPLADDHVHALLLDLRCNGQSGCPGDNTDPHPERDVRAAVQQLRRDGAQQVVVVGASYGGACALVAAARIGSQVDGVASLSGEPHLSAALDVPTVITRLQRPLLLAVAPGDVYVTVPQTRAMLRVARSPHKRLVVSPAEGSHGTALLAPQGAKVNPLYRQLVRFVTTPDTG